MKKEKKVWNNEKSKNRDNIMFLLLLDGQKFVQNLVSYKFLDIYPVYHSLFYIVFQLFLKSNVGQIYLYC